MKNLSLKWQMMLYLTPVIAIVFVLIVMFADMSTQRIALEKGRKEALLLAQQEAPNVLRVINKAVADTRTMGELLAALHTEGMKDRELTGLLLRDFLQGNPAYQGVWIVWEPNAFDGRDAEFGDHPYSGPDGSLAMYWYKGETGRIEVTGVNVRNETFYTTPKAERQLTLIEPYLDPAAQPPVLMTTVTLPIVKNGTVLGVFGIDIALAKLSELISAIRPYKNGYALLLSDKGVVLASPTAGEVGKNITDLPHENAPGVREILRQGKVLHREMERDGQHFLASYTPVQVMEGASPWSLEIVLPWTEIMAEATHAFHRTLLIGGVGLICIIATLLIGSGIAARPLVRLAGYASAISREEYNATIDARGFRGESSVLRDSLATMIGSLMKKMAEAEHHKQDAEHKMRMAAEATKAAEEARHAAEVAKREGMLTAARQLEDVAARVSETSVALSAHINQSERAANSASRHMSDTSAAMEEMNNTVLDVARNAGAASEVSAKTREEAEEGAAIVKKVVEGIRKVQREAQSLKEDMADLEEHAQSINRVMGVISDIADQTNLLALNAAIEAARAGEAGRGFAVVADEVRKLAEKTVNSTNDVDEAIKAIQQSAQKSMQQVDVAVEAIQEATALAGRSGNALITIVGMTDKTAEQVGAIAKTSAKQSATSGGITKTILNVNEAAGQTVQAMDDAATAVGTLAEQVKILNGLIAEMKRN